MVITQLSRSILVRNISWKPPCPHMPKSWISMFFSARLHTVHVRHGPLCFDFFFHSRIDICLKCQAKQQVLVKAKGYVYLWAFAIPMTRPYTCWAIVWLYTRLANTIFFCIRPTWIALLKLIIKSKFQKDIPLPSSIHFTSLYYALNILVRLQLNSYSENLFSKLFIQF